MGKIGGNGNIFLDVYPSNLVQSLLNIKTVKGGSVIKAYRYCFYILGHDKKQCGQLPLFDNLFFIELTNLPKTNQFSKTPRPQMMWALVF